MADVKKKETIKKAVKTRKTSVKADASQPSMAESTVSVSSKALKPAVKGKKAQTLTVEIFDVKGVVTGKMDLPAELFGVKVNTVLMTQAVRVYLTNQRRGTVSTKTRGEVAGSTRKIYRQKGTGRARHGGVRAPIFVKGGIAHGPKPKEYELSMPKHMRRAALFSALTVKHVDGAVTVIDGLAAIERKTKAMTSVLKALGVAKKVLVVMPKDLEHVYKAGRNIPGVTFTSADRLNTYEVLNTKMLVVMKDAVEVMKKTFLK